MAPFRAPEDWNGQGRDMSRPYRKTGYTVESEEDVMKYLALFGLFTIAGME